MDLRAFPELGRCADCNQGALLPVDQVRYWSVERSRGLALLGDAIRSIMDRADSATDMNSTKTA